MQSLSKDMKKYLVLQSFYSKITCPNEAVFYFTLRRKVGEFCRWAMLEDAVSTEIDVRELQKNYAIVVCKYSLKFCKKNVNFLEFFSKRTCPKEGVF